MTVTIIEIILVALFMLYTIVALADLSARITAVGHALMIIAGILRQNEEEAKESNESGQVG